MTTTTDMSGGPGAFRRLMNKVATWSIDSKRADESTTVFFTYCGSAGRIFHFP